MKISNIIEFFKYHWYGALISTFFIAYLIIFIVGIFNQELFEACNNELGEKIFKCEQNAWCLLKAFLSKVVCEVKVFI